jgi:hypothetical protein
MSGGAGRLRAGQFENSGDELRVERSAARLAGLVAQQAVDAFLGITLLPAPDHRTADAGAPGDLQNREPLGGKQHDLCALDMFERTRAIGSDRVQSLAVFVPKDDADSLGHQPRLARRAAFMNPMSASVH